MSFGQQQLGAAIGTRSFTEEYVSKKVKLWCDEILTLSTIAKTHSTVLMVHLFMAFYTNGTM